MYPLDKIPAMRYNMRMRGLPVSNLKGDFKMKKSVRILAVVMVLLMVTLVFASCGKTLSGTYETEVNVLLKKYTVTYEFKGSKLTVTQREVGAISGKVETNTYEGTYEIVEHDNGTMDIVIDIDGGNELIKDGTYVFAETEDYITIGSTKFFKK